MELFDEINGIEIVTSTEDDETVSKLSLTDGDFSSVVCIVTIQG